MSARSFQRIAQAGNRQAAFGTAMLAGVTVTAYYHDTFTPTRMDWFGACKFKLFSSDEALKRWKWKFDTSKLCFPSQKDQRPIVLVACGSYSPPTIFHLRMLEDAKDGLRAQGYIVAGGCVSPTHTKYGKKSLVDMFHRINMLGVALQDSDWIQVHPWECMQDEWTRTALVLSMMQDDISKLYPGARVMMLCGADLLESFPAIKDDGTPVWDPGDQQLILGKCGVVCMEREGVDLQQVILKNEILHKNKANIITFKPSSQNNISSTLVRKLLQKGDSIKYMVHEEILKYINEKDLKSKPAWQ